MEDEISKSLSSGETRGYDQYKKLLENISKRYGSSTVWEKRTGSIQNLQDQMWMVGIDGWNQHRYLTPLVTTDRALLPAQQSNLVKLLLQ